jgi:catechol 2,3-dioxygenase-like lactoylglutathione lyase family enzyme
VSRALRLLRVGLTVPDLARAAAFYADALGFAAAEAPRQAAPGLAAALGLGEAACATVQRLRLGAQEIELAEFDPPGRPYPPGSTSYDLWFQHIAIVVGDMAAAHARVAAHGGAAAITVGGPQRLPPSSGGVTAWKFRDPDGHPLELIAFPPGTGPAAWSDISRTALTVGFDHSAISIGDAGRSAAFYEGTLGLACASRQVNRGPEQERLDAAPGAVVDVVALDPAKAPTPHIELLGYRVPRGRSVPDGGLRANDVAATRLVLHVTGLDALTEELGRAGRLVSPEGVTDLGDGTRAALARDPDGHLLLLAEV